MGRVPSAEAETLLVSAMLPRRQLPTEYTETQWWCPSKASGAAAVRADMTAQAEMRIVYEVLGGSLPFGFMSKLQVSLVALTQSESVEEERTSASETAVVDRICGTVLSVNRVSVEGVISLPTSGHIASNHTPRGWVRVPQEFWPRFTLT